MSQRFLFAVVVASFVVLSDFGSDRPKTNSAQAAEQNKSQPAAAPQVHATAGLTGNARLSSPNAVIKNGARLRAQPQTTMAAHATNAVLKGAVQASSSKVQQQLYANGQHHHWHHHWHWGDYTYVPANSSSLVVDVPNGNTLLVTNPGATTSGGGFGVVSTPAVGHPARNAHVGPAVSLAGVNVPLSEQSTDPANLIRVRLAGIAAPLAGQAFYSTSRDHLAALAKGKQVRVFGAGVDPDGATVAQVFVASSGISLNYRQVRDGMAFQSFNDGCAGALHEALETAMTSRTGIWQVNRPVAPWIIRRTEPVLGLSLP